MKEKIAELQAQIDSLHDEITRERERASAYEAGVNMGTQLVAIRQGLIDSGLSEDLATEIMLTGVKANLEGLS